MQVFGTQGLKTAAAALHGKTGFDEGELRDAGTLRDLPGARAIARADVEQRATAGRNLGDDQTFDGAQIPAALLG